MVPINNGVLMFNCIKDFSTGIVSISMKKVYINSAGSWNVETLNLTDLLMDDTLKNIGNRDATLKGKNRG